MGGGGLHIATVGMIGHVCAEGTRVLGGGGSRACFPGKILTEFEILKLLEMH